MSDREQRDGGRSAENNKNNRGGNGRRNDRRNHQDNERDKYIERVVTCLLYTSPSPRDRTRSRMPSSA